MWYIDQDIWLQLKCYRKILVYVWGQQFAKLVQHQKTHLEKLLPGIYSTRQNESDHPKMYPLRCRIRTRGTRNQPIFVVLGKFSKFSFSGIHPLFRATLVKISEGEWPKQCTHNGQKTFSAPLVGAPLEWLCQKILITILAGNLSPSGQQ